jgi:hypothetical protein
LDYCLLSWSPKGISGDLYVDGKVIPRPQYRYAERQPGRSKPRPRHDRRCETMQVERRDPIQRQNWNQGQGGHMQPSNPMNSQNSVSGGESRGVFNRNSWGDILLSFLGFEMHVPEWHLIIVFSTIMNYVDVGTWVCSGLY